MAGDSNTIRILLTLDGKQYAADLKSAEVQTKALGNSAAGAGTQLSVLRTAALGAAGGLGSIVVAQVVPFLVQSGQEAIRLRERLEAITGSSGAARSEMAYLTAQADRLGVALNKSADNYTNLEAATRGTQLEGQLTRDTFEALTEASSKMNLEAQQTDQVFDAVEKIIAKNRATLGDYTGALSRNLPQALDATARGLGITTDRLRDMLREGGIASEEVIPALNRGLRETFNTDSQTRIDGTSQSIERLRNSMAQIGDVIGGPLASALGTAADKLIPILEYMRENPGAFLGLVATQQYGDLYSLASNAAQRRAGIGAYTPQPLRVPGIFETPKDNFYGPGTPASQNGLTGFSLLSNGVPELDTKLLKTYEQRVAYIKAESQYAQALYDVTEGRLKDENELVKQAALQAGKLADQKQAAEDLARERKRAAEDAQRDREAEVKAAVQREERDRESIRQAQIKAALLEHELATGERLSGAEEELFELQTRAHLVTGQNLEAELGKAAALERQVAAQRQLQSAAERFTGNIIGRAGPQSGGSINRDVRSQTSFIGIDTATQAARNEENARYTAELAELDAYHAQRAVSEERYYQTAEAAEQRHQITLNQITRAGGTARMQLTQSTLQGIVGVTDNLERAAQASGLARSKRGFEINKDIQIVQAGANTALAISNALAVSPYYVGLALAVTAGVAGAAQIAAIKAQQFPGAAAGYEKGGWARAGGMYQVAEKGKPELYEQNGNYYLMSGGGGRVTPASKAANDSGAVNVTVQVFGAGSEKVAASATMDGNNAMIQLAINGATEALRRDVSSNGTTSKLMQRTWALKRTGS